MSEAEKTENSTSRVQFKCKVRSANYGANEPQDCDWPFCGCDPYADKVIAAIEESGFVIISGSRLNEIEWKSKKS